MAHRNDVPWCRRPIRWSSTVALAGWVLAGLAACSSQSASPGAGGASGAGGLVGGGTGGSAINCETVACGPVPMCGQTCGSLCGCCSCVPGTRSGDLLCDSPGCYRSSADSGAGGTPGADASARFDCGGHTCAAGEICYVTTEGGGLVYACLPSPAQCSPSQSLCDCVGRPCFHGSGECLLNIPGELIFCTNEGVGPLR